MPCQISLACPCVVCADLVVNAKQSVEHRSPGIFRSCLPRRRGSKDLEISRAELLDRAGQRLRILFFGSILLVVQNYPVEPRTANADDRRSAGLTFQRNQSECLLHAWMNKHVRGT